MTAEKVAPDAKALPDQDQLSQADLDLVQFIFKALDTNGSGAVEKAELVALDKRGKLMSKLDTDKDGSVTSEEFIRYFTTSLRDDGEEKMRNFLKYLEDNMKKRKEEQAAAVVAEKAAADAKALAEAAAMAAEKANEQAAMLLLAEAKRMKAEREAKEEREARDAAADLLKRQKHLEAEEARRMAEKGLTSPGETPWEDEVEVAKVPEGPSAAELKKLRLASMTEEEIIAEMMAEMGQ